MVITMPKDKYKVHEVAKDFGLGSKDIIELLNKHIPKERKHSTVLDDGELDFVFDSLTKTHEVESLDVYLNSAKKAEIEQPVEEKAEKKDSAVKDDSKKKVKSDKPQEKGARKDSAKKADDGKAKQNTPKKQEQTAQPKKNDKPIQSRTKGERRHVDTRSSNVDLEKYNEHYEEIAPANRMKDTGSNKQKLKQKSQQYRKKQGMRSAKRETEAERLKRIAAERAKRPSLSRFPKKSLLVSLQHCFT